MAKKEFKILKLPLNTVLRFYFNKNLLYTVDKLHELTGEDKQYIRICISRMKNPKYIGKNESTLDLIQDIGIVDRVKRWGLRGAVDYADNEKFNTIKIDEIRNEETSTSI